MKIIEPGKSKAKWPLNHRCTGWGNDEDGCDALLELEFNDLIYHPGHFDEKCDSPSTLSFRCPCCKQITDIGLNEWPKNYREAKTWTTEWFLNKEVA